MSESVLAIIFIVALTLSIGAARYFRYLRIDFWPAARTPLLTGLVTGAILFFANAPPMIHNPLAGVLLTVAAFYSRLTGKESEPVDGMLLGSLAGAIAAMPFAIVGREPLLALATFVFAGSVAGWGVTYAWLHLADPMRQAAVDVVTAIAAVLAAATPRLAIARGFHPPTLALAIVAAVPFIAIAATFKQWRSIRSELLHEASMGFIDDADVRATAHPILRLGRGGWSDPLAHREFVRLATTIALRKRQQRYRTDDTARIYQLEIMKLRMQLREMSEIDCAIREGRPDSAEFRVPSSE